MITHERLKQVLDYDPDTGEFTWTQPVNRRIYAGKVAGTLKEHGYVIIQIDGIGYRAHRLAWLYVYGKFPDKQLDHINRIRSDNRILNLRLATSSENQQNLSIRKNNKSGFTGVHWHKRTKKWRAEITFCGRLMGLGYYDSIEDAVKARAEAKSKYHSFNPVDNDVKISQEKTDHRGHKS